MNYNRTISVGRLTRDVEFKQANSGMTLAKGSYAMDSGYGENKSAVFVDFTIFGKRAEAFQKFEPTKGKAFLFEGELRQDNWEDKETGKKRTKLYVVVNDFAPMEKRQQGQAGAQATSPAEFTGGVGSSGYGF